MFGALALIINVRRARSKVAYRWDFFLSHTQRNGDAKVVASELFYSFKEMHKECWLDVKMPKADKEARKDGVNGSK